MGSTSLAYLFAIVQNSVADAGATLVAWLLARSQHAGSPRAKLPLIDASE